LAGRGIRTPWLSIEPLMIIPFREPAPARFLSALLECPAAAAFRTFSSLAGSQNPHVTRSQHQIPRGSRMRSPYLSATLLLLASCARIEPNGRDLPSEQVKCEESSDCVLVESDCPCTNSGIVVSVNRESAEEVEAAISFGVCNTAISGDIGCSATGAVCSDQVCSLLFEE
jgi:hypothetical protein